MIKSETTTLAAEDLRKYQKALDQALLQYHSVKIGKFSFRLLPYWTLRFSARPPS